MAMTQCVDADSADQIDEPVPVDVLDHRPLRALDRDAAGERKPLQSRSKMALLVRNHLARLRPRNLGLNVRCFQGHPMPSQKPERPVRFQTPPSRARARSSTTRHRTGKAKAHRGGAEDAESSRSLDLTKTKNLRALRASAVRLKPYSADNDEGLFA